MTFLKDLIHVDVVEFDEFEDKYELLIDLYYDHHEAEQEEMQTTDEGLVIPVKIAGYEAIGYRFRIFIEKRHAQTPEELEEYLKHFYLDKAKELKHEVKASEVWVRLKQPEQQQEE